MTQLAGLVALAVVGLWIAYLVPQRLRYRQQLLESRTDDRFSEDLRVLAVTARKGRTDRDSAREGCDTHATKTVALLTPARGTPLVRGQIAGAPTMNRPHGTDEKVTADAARRAAQLRAHRAAALARRGAAARRRALLVAVLLVGVTGGWIAVGVGVGAAAGLVPSALLLGVLGLGRQAVVTGQRADAAWRAREATLPSAEATRIARGPVAKVTGRAVRPSIDDTQVIPTIRAGMARPEPVAETQVEAEAASEAASQASEEWAPVAVPRPTYTLKAAGPRWEPAPLNLEASGTAPAVSSGAKAEVVAETTLVDAEPTAASAENAEAPGLDLDAILARRRAAGQ